METVMSNALVLSLLDRHLAAENAHDLAGVLATLTDDCEFIEDALGLRWLGREGAAAHYTMWWDAFDLEVTGERLHVASSSAVAETVWRGTHVGEFAGIPATSRKIEIPVAVVIDFRDGLMAGERFYWDTAELARQLDVDMIPVVRVVHCEESGTRTR
jgi:steroid delta-isomerase-like uncharacterized protein